MGECVQVTTQPQTQEQYFVGESYLRGQQIAISKSQFTEICKALDVIIAVRDIEDLFEILIESNIELEKVMLNSGLEYIMGNNTNDKISAIFRKVRLAYNLRILTLLTAGQAYNDQVPQIVGATFVHSDELKEKIKQNLASVFDSSFEYRVMYALRNHAQHSKLPLGGMSFFTTNLYPSGRPSLEEPSRNRTTIEPFFKIDELAANKDIRRKTRDEISNLGFKKANAKYFVRKYISDLARHHSYVLGLIQDDFQRGIQVIESATAKLRTAKGSEVSLHAVYSKKDGNVTTQRNMSGEYYTRPINQSGKNNALQFLSRKSLSSEIVAREDVYCGNDDQLWITK